MAQPQRATTFVMIPTKPTDVVSSCCSSMKLSMSPPPVNLFSPPPSLHSLQHTFHHGYSILCTTTYNNLLFAGAQDSTILIYDLDTYTLCGTLTGHTGSILSLTIAASKRLVSTGSDSMVKIWDLETLQETHTVYSILDIGDIFSSVYVPSLNMLVFGCQNASLLYISMDVETEINGHESRLPSKRYDVFFDSLGPGGGKHDTQKTIESATNTIVEIPTDNTIPYAHNGFIYALKTFSIGSKVYMVSCSGDGMVKIWDTQRGMFKETCCLDNDEPVLSMDVQYPFLYCGLAGGVVKCWDISTKQLISEIEVSNDDIMAVAVDHQKKIYTGSAEGVLKSSVQETFTTEIATGGLVLTMSFFTKNDKSYLIAGGNDGALSLWSLHDAISIPTKVLNNDSLLDSLKSLVAFKTVSQNPSASMLESRSCATYLMTLLKRLGAKAELIPVEGGNPIVTGTFTANDRAEKVSRVLWYGHYDVIGGDGNGWTTDPFQMNSQDGYLYGRGVTDNKGPLLAAIYSVAESLQQHSLKSDVVFLIEGEEESGSFGFSKAIKKYKPKLGKIDWILLSNSYWLDDNVPCLNYGLRGVINASVNVSSDEPDRHSGFDGGVHREPTSDLIKIISKLQDDDGKIFIPGFNDPLQPITTKEREVYNKIVQTVEVGYSVEELISKWRMPSLSITTMKVSGPGNATVIPQSASINVSIRVVPEQCNEAIKESLTTYLHKCFQNLKTTNHLKVEVFHEAEPWLGDPTNHAYKVLTQEVSQEWAQEPLLVREGGSIPSVRFLEKEFDAPAAQIPCGQSSDNAHLDNERLRIENLYKLRNILKRVFNKL